MQRFTLKEADPLKHARQDQPILDEAASTDLGSIIRRRSGLAADTETPTSPPQTQGFANYEGWCRDQDSHLSCPFPQLVSQAFKIELTHDCR